MEISESSSFSLPDKVAERIATDAFIADPDFKSSTMAESEEPKHSSEDKSVEVRDDSRQSDSIAKNDGENKSENPRTDEDEWLDIMGSGQFKKKVLKKGLGHETRPGRGDCVTVDMSCFIDDSELFEEKNDLKFIVGDLDVIQGLDLAICLMEKGERALIQIPSKLAYGTAGLLPNVPPDTDILCKVELKEVEPFNEESLSIFDRLKLGDEKRSRGNFFYSREQHLDAIHCYERSIAYLEGVQASSDSSPADLQKIVDLKIKVYNNMAASQMKIEAYPGALKSVESVLRVQPNNVKALFRKGKILGAKGNVDEAIECMKSAANLEPETKIFQIELARLKCRKKKEELSQREMYKRMFKSESAKPAIATSWMKKWSIISGGVLAVAIGTAIAYRQYH